jgi:predicted amidohydrolase YtcJ
MWSREIAFATAPVRIAVLNATIWTGDPRNPWVDAMGIDGARVAILGTVQQVH